MKKAQEVANNIYADEDSKNLYKVLVKENKQLKAQIEKMKCCGNCEHFYCGSEKECPMGHTCMTIDMTPCNEWELVK